MIKLLKLKAFQSARHRDILKLSGVDGQVVFISCENMYRNNSVHGDGSFLVDMARGMNANIIYCNWAVVMNKINIWAKHPD